MEIPTIDLKIFAPRYRQALLYAMIEGLNEGAAFSFSDDRDPNDIELELSSAGLNGYRWARANSLQNGASAYLIERNSKFMTNETCCKYCCGTQLRERS